MAAYEEPGGKPMVGFNAATAYNDAKDLTEFLCKSGIPIFCTAVKYGGGNAGGQNWLKDTNVGALKCTHFIPLMTGASEDEFKRNIKGWQRSGETQQEFKLVFQRFKNERPPPVIVPVIYKSFDHDYDEHSGDYWMQNLAFVQNVQRDSPDWMQQVLVALGGSKATSKFTRDNPFPFALLDFTDAPRLKLHEGTISFDRGEGYKVQYGGRTPQEEARYLTDNEETFYQEHVASMKCHGVSLGMWPPPMSEAEARDVLEGIRTGNKFRYCQKSGTQMPLVTKGFPGNSDFAIISAPGHDVKLWNGIYRACLEMGIPLIEVFDPENITGFVLLLVWKRNFMTVMNSQELVVLTKQDGSVGFTQSIMILTALEMAPAKQLHVMPIASFLEQIRSNGG